ncbi:hypothetical protein ACHAXS_005667, partial [Conticribra weissflogii]
MLPKPPVNNRHARLIDHVLLHLLLPLPISHRRLVQNQHDHSPVHDLLLLPHVLLPPRQKTLKQRPKEQRMPRRDDRPFRQNAIVEDRPTKFLEAHPP